MTDAEQALIHNYLEGNFVIPTFPFASHPPRDGEPPYPTFHKETEEDDRVMMEWVDWAWEQPDHPLLLTDYHQRGQWEHQQGDISRSTAKKWIYERQVAITHSEPQITAKFWANNDEFQMLTPAHAREKLEEIMNIVRTSSRFARRSQNLKRVAQDG